MIAPALLNTLPLPPCLNRIPASPVTSEPPLASCPEFISKNTSLAEVVNALCTANFSEGSVVPMPTLPELSIVILCSLLTSS